MKPFSRRVATWLRRRGEVVIAGLLAIMFAAFIVQIVFRYVFNLPVGWTSELTVVAWMWMVLLGSAFVLREREEIRFDLLYASVGRRGRRAMGMATGLAIVVLYAVSLPAAIKYVGFMKVEHASYLKIRFDYLYSIYVIFAVAIIVRYVWIVWQLLLDENPDDADPTTAGSGL